MRLLLIGSGTFALPAFAALAASAAFEIVGVVTAAPRPAGRNGALRSTPVAAWATRMSAPLIEVARIRDERVIDQIAALNADVALLADFGQIIPAAMLATPRRGILNIHPSLLPRHRGASPIPAAILAGDSETGVSTIVMDEGLDTGPILDVQRLPLRGDEIAVALEEQLALIAAQHIGETVEAWAAGRIEARPQGETGATLAPRLRRSDGRIGAAMSADVAWRTWRAYQPWPGAFVELPGAVERLRIDRAGPPIPAPAGESGTLVLHDGRLLLLLSGGALPLLRVTPAGGREMEGEEFARGREDLLASHARIAG